MRTPNVSYQARLILGFTGMCLLVGLLSLFFGISIINRAVFVEVTNRVSQDLNAAWELFLAPIGQASPVFRLAADDEQIHEAVARGDIPLLSGRLASIREVLDLDFASAIIPGAQTVRVGYDGSVAPVSGFEDDFVSRCIELKIPLSGVAMASREFLLAEAPELAEQARISIIPTPKAAPRDETEETRGMILVCAYPMMQNGTLTGLLYGGILINRNNTIIDHIRDVVFRQERYKNLDLGTATVFLDDIRVATNVLDSKGKRAIGTQVSKEVKDLVLGEGSRWSDRAFVVSNWYRTAYDPIVDVNRRRVGMLYVGVLEAKYLDYRLEALTSFTLIIVGGILIAIIAAYLFSRATLRPINRLVEASRKVGEGQFDLEIGPLSRTEIGVLQKTFVNMLASFRERVERQEKESSAQLFQSEKQAILGRLAAGVAHEINNPLTSVLTFSHLLLERDDLPKDAMGDLRVISESTERVRQIVRGLLDYSRRDELHQAPTDLNELIESTITLLGSQLKGKERKLEFEPDTGLPLVTVDRNQIQSVLMNLLLNAADAITGPGTITISTEISVSTDHVGRSGVDISIADTGKGIAPEHLAKLFDPFFTTKEAGKGTGLGLAVSKNIIGRHGGTIRVRSALGAGSVFSVWLPFDRLEADGE